MRCVTQHTPTRTQHATRATLACSHRQQLADLIHIIPTPARRQPAKRGVLLQRCPILMQQPPAATARPRGAEAARMASTTMVTTV